MKKICLSLMMFLAAGVASAQVYERTPRTYDFELSDFAKRITPVLSFNRNMHPAGWVWKEGRSSALVEKGKPTDFYEINKLSDIDESGEFQDCATAWVEGVDGDGIGEWVIVPVGTFYDEDVASKLVNHEISENLKITLCVLNGYQQNVDLYKKNNRVKDAKISVYAAAYSCGQDDAYLLWNPDCIYEETITLNDDIIRNPGCFNTTDHVFFVTLPEKYRNESCELYLKFEIKSVYKGTKYSDTCISDMWANLQEVEEGPVLSE